MAGKNRAKDVSYRLLGVLEAKGWRKTDLIVRSGLNQASVYEWLRGESEPRGEALRKLAQALEVSTDYLLRSDPSYDELTPAQVAASESLRLCLRGLGIGPADANYVLYEELALSEGAPKSVKGWHDLITKVLPRIREHLRERRRSHDSDRPARVFPLKGQGPSHAEGTEPSN